MPSFPSALISKAVHSGEARRYSRSSSGVEGAPVVGGIHPSIGYVYDDTRYLDAALGGHPDYYVYGRYGNPTVTAFEEAMVALACHDMPDRAEDYFAIATASGMAAIHLAMAAVGAQAGATVAAAQDCYGATYSLIDSLWPQYGVRGVFVDATSLDEVERMLAQVRPLFLIVETISNPLLKVADVEALADLCHAHDALLLVDNTFATPALYRPLAHGADVVVHSATKYIGGHGDVLGGVVIAHRRLRPPFWEFIKKTGANLGPHEAWLLRRGLKTLPLRVERQWRNACDVAERLRRHPAIGRVHFPGLAEHPQHALAVRQFGGVGFGAVVAFEIAGADQARIFRFFEALQMVQPATTVGDIYSLVLYPAHSSHRALSPQQRAAVGISDGLVRLAVGVEAVDDIMADLIRALE